MKDPIHRLPWFDRRFAFAFEADVHPSVVERLRGLMPRLEHKLAGVPDEVLRERWDGAWSVQENVGHLLDLEELWIGRVDDLFGGADVLRPADLENRKTHEADHNAADADRLVRGLAEARGRLVARLDAAAPDDFARTARHPRLEQPMRLVDLAYFVAEHDDHHLARITGILRALGRPAG